MKTVILCAGRGKRLKGLTEHLPKPLVKVKGKALLEYVLEAFIDSGIKEKDIVLVTGYQRQKIAKFLHEKRFFVNMVENPDWEHTNMVHSFYKGIESLPEEDVILSYGDIIYSTFGVVESTFSSMLNKGLDTSKLVFGLCIN